MKQILLLSLLAFIVACAPRDNQAGQDDYLIQPVPFTRVKVTDQFWSKRIETNHKVTIPIAIQKSRETGRIRNFAIAGGLETGKFCTIFPFDDSDIYKIIEGAAYSLQMFPDPKLEATCDSLIQLIGLAQEEDGYLYTNRTIMGDSAHPWAGTKRWEKVDDLSHELYNLGHFYEAATAYYQTTGKREILDIAIKSADLVDRDFGKGKIENWPGHQEVEIGLVKLYRQTGEKRYLDLARFFLDVRGRGIGKPRSYNQSHIPVVEQSEALGHSVRAAYMWSGMADVAALTGDTAYIKAIGRIWEDVVHKKLYITGGIGAEGGHEGFGGAYELPNERAYCETCAGIANVFWNHRMFLMTGDSKFIDVLERSLYNNVLSGVSLSGDHFFYPNPLESHGQHHRSEWFGCACCPSNVSRLIPSMPNYIYAIKDNDIYVNLFVQSQATLDAGGKQVTLEQTGEMPWDGQMKITINTKSSVKAKLHLRIPSWATDSSFPGELYKFADKTKTPTIIKVNGTPIEYNVEKGFAIIENKWKNGDVVEIAFPFEPRRIEAHQAITENSGKIALQRGPLVYCTEFADYENQQLPKMILPRETPLNADFRPDLLGGVTVITADAVVMNNAEDQDKPEGIKIPFTAIPYYGWSHRGRGAMKVWIPATAEAAMGSYRQKQE